MSNHNLKKYFSKNKIYYNKYFDYLNLICKLLNFKF